MKHEKILQNIYGGGKRNFCSDPGDERIKDPWLDGHSTHEETPLSVTEHKGQESPEQTLLHYQQGICWDNPSAAEGACSWT